MAPCVTALLVFATLLLGVSADAHARITHIVINAASSQSTTFDGAAFGAVGQYEKIVGRAMGEVDHGG